MRGGDVGKEEEEMFPKGSRVEVTSKEGGFVGIWFTATVISTPSSEKRSKTTNRQKYLVKYDNLVTDDNPSKPLSENVNVSLIRPEQPTDVAGDDGFQVKEVVDVNRRDGWWTGVVKKVVNGGSKYLVHFENPPDEVECNGSDIRIHLDWVDRKWVRPDKQKTIESKDEEVHTRRKRARPQESLSKFPKGSKDPLVSSHGKSSEVDNLDSGAIGDATDVNDDEMPSHTFGERALLTTTIMNNEVSVNCENVEESQRLPFKKSSPVWKSIESMEVFQKTPQRPHFSPLVNCSENYREGLAVGHMITFANLVEKTLTLKFSDPQSIIENGLETLKELENHGFDVEDIQNRLTELKSLKGRVDKLEDASKKAEAEITELNEEKKELEELMDKVERKMKMIKEKLGGAASMKEAKVKQINVLQSKVNFFDDSLEGTKCEFDRIAVSPL